MGLFIIGDVHGCFHTYMKLLEYWDSKNETLVQVGDLIDRGNFSPLSLRLSKELQASFKTQCVYLMGNHEYMMIKYLDGKDIFGNWLANGGDRALVQFENMNLSPAIYLDWIRQLPLFWESEYVYCSHAGISSAAENPFDLESKYSVIWNRQELKNLGKLQVIGHTPLSDGVPNYTEISNSWNIDTGAYRGINLSAIRLSAKGELVEKIIIPTDERDLHLEGKL